MVVDIFGHPHDHAAIKKIAKKYNLKLIIDSAQTPYSFYGKKIAKSGWFKVN